jgi:HK97 gp10 family phage protein
MSDGIWSGVGADRGSLNIKVEVVGLKDLQGAAEKIQKAVDRELLKGLHVAAKRVEREAKDSIRKGNKSGRLYEFRVAGEGEKQKRWVTMNGNALPLVKRWKPHRASAPGEAPATDTGRLVNSIVVESSAKREGNELVAKVFAGRGAVKYARMLEFGTAKIRPRPFMFPALEKSKQFISERLAKAVNDALTKIVPPAPPPTKPGSA